MISSKNALCALSFVPRPCSMLPLWSTVLSTRPLWCSVRLLCLGAGSRDSSVRAIKHTHAAISPTRSQKRMEARKGCWTESRYNWACSVTACSITPFEIRQQQRDACQNPSDRSLLFPNNILDLYIQCVQHPITKAALDFCFSKNFTVKLFS